MARIILEALCTHSLLVALNLQRDHSSLSNLAFSFVALLLVRLILVTRVSFTNGCKNLSYQPKYRIGSSPCSPAWGKFPYLHIKKPSPFDISFTMLHHWDSQWYGFWGDLLPICALNHCHIHIVSTIPSTFSSSLLVYIMRRWHSIFLLLDKIWIIFTLTYLLAKLLVLNVGNLKLEYHWLCNTIEHALVSIAGW